MLSYISPPIVAAFILGVFNKRTNANGAFIGLIGGLVVAVVLLFFKTHIFGNLHFLLIVPFLFTFSLIVIYIASLFSSKPSIEKLTNTTFSKEDFIEEYYSLKGGAWYKNYLVWSFILLIICALIWFIFR